MPQLDATTVPIEEREAVEHIKHLLSCLRVYQENFYHAAMLFEACTAAHQRVFETTFQGAITEGRLHPQRLDVEGLLASQIVTGGWQEVAARDGVITIFNFGETVAAIKFSLANCRSLRVDHTKIRLGYNLFYKGAFRDHDAIRNALAHAAKFHSSLNRMREHSQIGPFALSVGNVSMSKNHPKAVTHLSGSLIGNAYMVTYEGKPYGYQISSATAKKLDAIAKTLNSAF